MPGSTVALAAAFLLFAGLSLASSSTLIVRIERLGSKLGVTEAILGLAAALAADAPEITSAITALVRGQNDVGVGVVLGANVFQIAALLGLGAYVARGIILHRRVVVFEGFAAVWVAVLAFGVVARGASAWLALILGLAVFVPYIVISAMDPRARARLPLPGRFRRDLTDVMTEEEDELTKAIGPLEHHRSDGPIALLALVTVVAASAALEGVATELADRWSVPDVILGGIVLAVVTSLPNVVAAVHLARRGRGAATLSEAMNSGRINTLAGLLIPAALLGGVGATEGMTSLAAWYVLMTMAVLAVAALRRGLSRSMGLVIMATYAVVIITLVT
ncbi:MAG: sodium:calcium antiporter [Actinomycetes bacterium]